MMADLDDPPPEHLGGHGLAPGGLCLGPHDPLGEHHVAADSVSQQHLGEGLLVSQERVEGIRGDLREGRQGTGSESIG